MNYIVVTGGTGFIGSHLVERLLGEDYNVILLKRSFSYTWRIEHLFDKYPKQLISVDVDLVDLEDVFSKYSIEGVFHLATYYNKRPTFEEINPMAESNLLFPINIINLAVKYGVKYFINTGTFMEYTLNDEQLVASYDLDPKIFYSATKISFEEIVKYFEANFDIKASTLKIYSPFGDKDETSKIVPYLINNILDNREISINFPENKLNLVYVDDIVSAFVKVMENIMKFDKYESFDVANNVSYSLGEIHRFIENYIKNDEADAMESFGVESIPDIKHNEKISWSPEISIEEGLKRTIEYYKGE